MHTLYCIYEATLSAQPCPFTKERLDEAYNKKILSDNGGSPRTFRLFNRHYMANSQLAE